MKSDTFIDWLNKTGTAKVAELLKVEPATVRYWRRRDNYPRVDQMRLIKEITKGRVNYDSIIDGK